MADCNVDEAVRGLESKPRERVLRVLVVDDFQPLRAIARRLLQAGGHYVVEAADGHDAVESLRGTSFDLVLLDLSMPGMDGVAVLEWMRHTSELHHQPHVAVVSAWGTDHREQLERLGVHDVLSKPFRHHQLEELLLDLAATPRRPETGEH